MPRALSTGLCVLSILLVVLNIGVMGGVSSIRPVNATLSPNAPFNYIVVIMLENRNYADIIGNPAAPYLTQLANSYSLAANYHDVSQYGSLPNYLGTIAGQSYDTTWSRCNTSPPACAGWPPGGVTDPTVVNRIESAGLTWKAYMESMPINCYDHESLPYMALHNPYIYFSQIINNPSECARDIPTDTSSSNLLSDLQSTSTASNFVWLTPNNCDDMWGCSTSTGDTYLSNLVPKILSSTIFQTQKAALFITWDEGSNSGHVPGIWAGPVVKRGYASSINYDHYSLLKTIETGWSLASVNTNDASATAMTEFFTSANTIQPSFSFTPPNPIINQNVTFTGTVTGGTSPYRFVWNFGDGNITAGNPVKHKYLATGTYTVTLSVKDSTGLTGSTGQMVTVTGPPDYTITLNPTSLTINIGGTGTSSVTLNSINSFTGTLTLATSVSPQGPTISINPTSVFVSSGGTATSTLTAQLPNNIAAGNYTVTVTASNGTLTHSATVRIIARAVPDFSIITTPSNLVIVQGGTGSSTITLASLNGFSGSVSLSVSISVGGIDTQMNPNNLNIKPGVNATSILVVSPHTDTIPGAYTISVNGQSGQVTHLVTIPLTVTSFTLNLDPGSLAFRPGSTGTFDVVLNSINGFNGTVGLSFQTNNNQLIASLGSRSLSLKPGGTNSTTLTIGSSVQGGYNIAITASFGRLNRNIQVQVSVTTQPNFYVSATPIFLATQQGSSINSTITVTSVNGLSGNVKLQTNINPGAPVTVTLNPPILQLVSDGSAQTRLTLNVPNSVPSGIYYITVTGNLGPNHPVILSLYVVKPVPDFAISTNPNSRTVTAGGSTGYNIELTSIDGFAGTITLTTNSQPSFSSSLNPPVVTLSASGFTTSNLTITTTSTTSPATYTFTITATSGVLTHTTTVALVVTAPPGFALNTSPGSLTVLAATSGNATVSLNNYNGFTGTVNLSTTTSPSTGLSCILSPASITGSQTSTLSCKGSAGFYTVTVNGMSGSLSHSANVTYDVQDFAISAGPPSVSVPVNQAGASTINVTALQGFSGTVSLNSNSTSCSLAPSSVTGSGSSSLSCTFSSPGKVYVKITGTSASLSHTVTIVYNVGGIQDFTISASPSSVSVLANASGTSTISVSSVNGFAGTIALSASASPTTGLSCSLNPTSISLGASGSSTLSCSGSAGSYNVTVSGTNRTLSHSTTVAYTVKDYALSTNPTSVNANAGSAGTSTITITAKNGFSGTVSLTTNSTACTIGPSNITGSGNATLSCTFSSSGRFQVTVVGTSGALSHSATVTYNVGPPPGFTLSANPTIVTILAGANGNSTITVQGSGGFVGTVALSDTVSPSSGLTCSLSPSSVNLVSTGMSGTSTLSCMGSPNSYTVTVTGASGNANAATTVVYTVQDFGLTANPSSIGFAPGGSSNSTITVTGLQGFSGTVNLSSVVSSPSITDTLIPTTVTGSGLSTLQVSGSTTGTYSVTVTGTSGSLTHSITVTVSVGGSQDFQLSASPASIILYPGGSNASIVSITPVNSFSGNTTLSANLPTGFTAQFSNNPVSAGSTSKLTISAASSIAAGTYSATITGTSGSLVHSISISISVHTRPSIAFVAGVPVAGSSSTTATTSSLPFHKGDLIVVYVSVGNGQTVNSITDSGSPSSTYTQRTSAVNGNTILYLYTATAATSTNNTITVTMSAPGYLEIGAAEYSGVIGFGASNTNTGLSTTPTVSLTTQNPNSWVVVAYGWTGSGTHSGDTGFTDRHAGSIGTQHLDYGDTNAAKPAGIYTYSATISQSNPWAMIALELV